MSETRRLEILRYLYTVKWEAGVYTDMIPGFRIPNPPASSPSESRANLALWVKHSRVSEREREDMSLTVCY